MAEANTVEYSEAFAAYILEARDLFKDLEAQIDRGGVPAGRSVTLKITIPAVAVDQIRADRLAVAASQNGDSHG